MLASAIPSVSSIDEVNLLPLKFATTMKKTRLIEVAVKVIVAALTAFLTAISTTSCLGYGPF